MSVLPASRSAAQERRTSFVSDSVNQELSDHGYAVLPQRLPRGLVDDLAALHRGVVEDVGQDTSGRFLPTMTISRPDLRARLWDGVRETTRSTVEPLFAPGTTELLGGSFVSKPGSANSVRRPHQDPTIFDEARHVSISFWIPLSDSRISNGTLYVLPGSHRMGNPVRPPDVDSFDEAVAEIALRESVPVELDAGQILVLDGALIHHSPANDSDLERVAAIVAVRSVGADMHLVRSQDGAPEGTADIFDVGVEMYRSGDLATPGLDGAPLVGRASYRRASPADLHLSRSSG